MSGKNCIGSFRVAEETTCKEIERIVSDKILEFKEMGEKNRTGSMARNNQQRRREAYYNEVYESHP